MSETEFNSFYKEFTEDNQAQKGKKMARSVLNSGSVGEFVYAVNKSVWVAETSNGNEIVDSRLLKKSGIEEAFSEHSFNQDSDVTTGATLELIGD